MCLKHRRICLYIFKAIFPLLLTPHQGCIQELWNKMVPTTAEYKWPLEKCLEPNYFCQIPGSVRRLITEKLPYCFICWIWSHPVLSAGQDQGSRSLFPPIIVLNTCFIQALFNIFGEVIRQSIPSIGVCVLVWERWRGGRWFLLIGSTSINVPLERWDERLSTISTVSYISCMPLPRETCVWV